MCKLRICIENNDNLKKKKKLYAEISFFDLLTGLNFFLCADIFEFTFFKANNLVNKEIYSF